ncbi:MAG: membrane protein insertase YidC [Alistipes sp.]|nr:membrane protein insertase YidC [Alistipes sp.]
MDKKSIAGIAIVGLLFVIFTVINGRQQREYQQKLREYREYEAAHAPAPDKAIDADSLLAETPSPETADSIAAAIRTASVGQMLAEAAVLPAETITVSNDVMTVDFSTRGGMITGVELKDYTRYAPKGERNENVRMFVPESAYFDMSFSTKNGLNDMRVNTADYTFELLPQTAQADGQTVVSMRLQVSDEAAVRYDYTLYNTGDPARDYLIDLRITPEGLDAALARSNPSLEWRNTSLRNEKGFSNENMYTTLSYRFPGESSVEELGMSTESKSKSVNTSVNWVAFKQQFFTSAIIARNNFTYADMAFTTEQPESGLVKNYSLKTALPYAAGEDFELALYFGPNKYSILKNVRDADGESLSMERLIPLGWWIIGAVNRWIVIPVFDFLRRFIGNFGVIILILALLVKLLTFPLSYRSYVSTAKMRVIKPEVDALAQKFPRQEDAMKRQQATMELYKKAGINPLGGCIPMLIQFPFIIAMFRFFPASIELRSQSFLWADDLSSYDSVIDLPFSIPFYGDHVSLFALLMAVALFAFSYVSYNQTASAQPQMAGMKFMMVYMMPVMMLFWFNNYSSGLCYYYFLANIITIIQTTAIRRMIDDDKIHAIIQANAAKNKNRKKSKFQLRYEELMRQQEQMNKRK